MLKRILCIAVLMILVFTTGCAHGQTESVPPTVADLFEPPETSESQPDSMSLEEWQKNWPKKVGGSIGFTGLQKENREYGCYVYEGGELNAQILVRTQGMKEIGVGVFVFLDGRPQPYRLADGDEYAYMHTFYQEDNVEMIHDVYLIPVTGQEGDVLEMQVVSITWPDYFLDQGRTVAQHTAGTSGFSVQLVMEATPEAQNLPAVPDRLQNVTIEHCDLKASEIEGWTADQMRKDYESHYYLNGKKDGSNLYGFTAGSAEFQYELWGNPTGTFGFVLFVDNQPVSVSPEDVILFSNENGKKTVITMELDLSDFDGSSVIYGFLLGRNYLSNGIGNGASESFRETWVPYYLSDAQDTYDLMGWEETE